ncbi:MAG: hypothetical protein ACT4PS_07395 [Betaproteobacteria bacterium]
MKNAKHSSDFAQKLDMPDAPHFIVDEDEPPCAEYVLMREQDNMPALQEYMLEMQADVGIAWL